MLGSQRLETLHRGQVTRESFNFWPRIFLPDRGYRVGYARLGTAVDDHRYTLARQTSGDRQADSCGRSTDQRNFSLQQ